jgi:integrase
MPRLVRSLTDSQIRAVKGEGRHTVAPGVYLRISGQSRMFEMRYTDRNHKRVWRQIGNAKHTTIAEARRVAEDAIDGKVEQAVSGTFAEAAERYVDTHKASWNPLHAHQWRQTLDDYILPGIGRMKISDILPADVAAVLAPIWTTKTETARRVRGRIENVIDTAQAEAGVVALNPAAMRLIKRILPKLKSMHSEEHHPAPTVEQLGKLLNGLSTRRSCQCLRFLALTIARTTETRLADWSEIDLRGKVWVIPKGRMKAKRVHRVPLSKDALSVLGKKPKGGGLVFGNLSLGAMRELLVKRELPYTVHGIRSTFRVWAARAGYPRELCEFALAHVVGSKAERAYMRDDLLELRRPMMEAWTKELAKHVA